MKRSAASAKVTFSASHRRLAHPQEAQTERSSFTCGVVHSQRRLPWKQRVTGAVQERGVGLLVLPQSPPLFMAEPMLGPRAGQRFWMAQNTLRNQAAWRKIVRQMKQ